MHWLQQSKAHDRRDKDAHDFAHIGRQQELDRFADIVVDPASFFYGIDDGRKIVIGQDHIRHILCDIRAGDTHTDADIGCFDRWCVIDTVARHCRDRALLFPSIHNAYFMFRLHPGIDVIISNIFLEFFFAQTI